MDRERAHVSPRPLGHQVAVVIAERRVEQHRADRTHRTAAGSVGAGHEIADVDPVGCFGEPVQQQSRSEVPRRIVQSHTGQQPSPRTLRPSALVLEHFSDERGFGGAVDVGGPVVDDRLNRGSPVAGERSHCADQYVVLVAEQSSQGLGALGIGHRR